MKFLSTLLLFVLILSTDWLRGQTPQSINYQAVVRDGETGGELVNQAVDMLFTVLGDGPNSDAVYQEIHQTETNAFGLVNLRIGNGEPVVGTMEDIEWGVGEKWLLVELDLGDGYEEISNSRFVSVPYALHADVAATADNVDDADADPTNEWIDTLTFDNNVLNAYQGGFPDGHVSSVNLGDLVDDADADPTNELIDTLLIENGILSTYQGGFPDGHLNSIDLNSLIDDADADPTNELIDPDGILLIDTVLFITEGGVTHEINLAGLANYGPWLEGSGVVYNEDANIGIGTNDPLHKLQVMNQSDAVEDSVAAFVLTEHSGDVSYGVFGRASGATENRALYGDAPGVGDDRWAGYFDRGNVHIANRLSIGQTTTPGQFNISGIDATTSIIHTETEAEEPALHVQGDGKVGVRNADPHSALHVNGSVAGSVRFEEASLGPFALNDEDYMLIVDVTGGPATVTLPAAAGCEGRVYFVKRTHSIATNNTLTITPFAGDAIDSVLLPVLLSSASAKEAIMLVSAGSNGWFIMSE